jgi:DNA-binding response OmpR family regulator
VRLFCAWNHLSTRFARAAAVNSMRRNILIVDDDHSIRTLLRLVAERRGLSVDLAGDGVEALQLLGEHRYDLAIIDLMMPRLNGYELVDGMSRHAERPAIVIATAMTDSLIGLLDATIVHSIIRKPFDIEMLGDLMTEIVVQSRQREAATDDAAQASVQNAPEIDHVC